MQRSPGVRLQPLLTQAIQAGASLGAEAKRVARHVACKPRAGGKQGLRFNLGLVKRPDAAGNVPSDCFELLSTSAELDADSCDSCRMAAAHPGPFDPAQQATCAKHGGSLHGCWLSMQVSPCFTVVCYEAVSLRWCNIGSFHGMWTESRALQARVGPGWLSHAT